jgi:hypothetical protein
MKLSRTTKAGRHWHKQNQRVSLSAVATGVLGRAQDVHVRHLDGTRKAGRRQVQQVSHPATGTADTSISRDMRIFQHRAHRTHTLALWQITRRCKKRRERGAVGARGSRKRPPSRNTSSAPVLYLCVCVCVCVCVERERAGGRERDRQRERKRQRDRERERDTKRAREKKGVCACNIMCIHMRLCMYV